MKEERDKDPGKRRPGRPEGGGHREKATAHIKKLVRLFRKDLVDNIRNWKCEHPKASVCDLYTHIKYTFPLPLFKENEEIINYLSKVTDGSAVPAVYFHCLN